MTDDLVSRLLAAIQEREEAANDSKVARNAGEWGVADQPPTAWGDTPRDAEIIAGGKPIARFDDEYGGSFHAEHVVRNDPRAVLRLCQAHRKIIDLHEPSVWLYWNPETGENEERPYCVKCAMGESCSCCLDSEDRVWPCETLIILAEGYDIEAQP